MTEPPDFAAIAASSRHGSRSRYKAGCRCDDCREANASYQRRRRQELRSDQADPGGGWLVAIAGIGVGLAVAWGVIRKAGSG